MGRAAGNPKLKMASRKRGLTRDEINRLLYETSDSSSESDSYFDNDVSSHSFDSDQAVESDSSVFVCCTLFRGVSHQKELLK